MVLDKMDDFLYVLNMFEKCVLCVNFLGEVIWNLLVVDYIIYFLCFVVEGGFIYCCDWMNKGVNFFFLDGK